MSSQHSRRGSSLARTARKYFVSTFVVFTFGIYILHEHLTPPDSLAGEAMRAQDPVTTSWAPTPEAPAPAVALAAPPAPPTDVPTPAPVRGQYRDGSYAGQVVDAYYGYVQVQATVAQGRLTDVQILEYPNDRRTSIRINNYAIPYLTQESLHAQSANVDIISGATLTSEAYIESLASALTSARA
jgi:uncharacterized protein with FMN-binding domain